MSVAEFGIIELDYLEGTAVADEKAAQLFDLPANQKLTRAQVHLRFHPDDLAEIESKVAESLLPSGAGDFTLEHRVIHADRSVRWVNVRKRIFFEEADGKRKAISGIVVAVDVTERKEAEEKLRASENRLRLAAEATGFGTYELDSSNSEPIWSSEMFEIFGVPKNQAISRSKMFDLIHEDDRQQIRELIDQFSSNRQPGSFQLDHRIIRPSGEVRWISNSGTVIQGSESQAIRSTRVIGTMQDITDRMAFEQSLKTAKKTAESANRCRGEFLANMSHEIRTPMAAILGHADILKDHLTDPDNLHVVETIRLNGKYLLKIINDILDLSKIDAGKLEVERSPVRPDSVVAEVRSLMDVRAAEKSLPFRIEFSTPIPEFVDTDAIRLRQILVNLVGNAIKFTDNGEVKLRVCFDPHAKKLRFEVHDSGIGIESERIDALFNPFVQLDNTSTRSFGGTGLGLAICKRLARALDGEVIAESQFGKGSRFTLTLDVAGDVSLVEPSLTFTRPAHKCQKEVRLNARVLVVDDRREIRYLAQHFIERAGGRVVTATNGREAIEILHGADSQSIDVIVMDMQMPVMDGYEASRVLRQSGCKIPIVALTANAMKSDRDECLASGCSDYTTKPLDSNELVAIIHRLANQKA